MTADSRWECRAVQPPRAHCQPSSPITMAVTCGDIPRLICSVIIPPVGVFFQVGCTKDLGINILLTLPECVDLGASSFCS